jgi:hypothetical protein
VPRDLDEPIPEDEALYRGLHPDHFEGQVVLPAAIDSQGTSVNRHKYNPDPQAAISKTRGETGVASVCVRNFPAPLKTTSGSVFKFRADDRPTEENPAHAEIGVEKDSTPVGRIKNPVYRSQLKALLADKMRVLPTAPATSSL